VNLRDGETPAFEFAREIIKGFLVLGEDQERR
jgi:hypothetical protein